MIQIGNPVQYGPVLVPTLKDPNKCMYNQLWARGAEELMRKEGINPEGKTDAELIGYYLAHGYDSLADPDLSYALAKAISTTTKQLPNSSEPNNDIKIHLAAYPHDPLER